MPRQVTSGAGVVLPELPRRLIVTRTELLQWCAAAGTALPWPVTRMTQSPSDGSRLGDRLAERMAERMGERMGERLDGAVAGRPEARRGGARRAGRPDWDGRNDPEVRAALRVLDLPDLMVDLDLVHPCRSGSIHLRSWHRVSGALAVGLSTIDGEHFSLVWCAPSGWGDELVRCATVPDPVVGPAGGQVQDSDRSTATWPTYLEVPLEAIVTAGSAQTQRTDLRAEAVSRWGGAMREYDDHGAQVTPDPARIVDWLPRPQTRLQAAVMVPRPDTPVGMISWVGDRGQWWELSPLTRGSARSVAIGATETSALPSRIGRFLPRLMRGAAA